MLLTLDAVRLAGGHAPGKQPMIDTLLLVGMPLIDRLRLRGSCQEAQADHGGEHATGGSHGILLRIIDGAGLRAVAE